MVSQNAHVAFVYSKNIVYPAIEWNIKISYISKELVRRGIRVSWVQIDGEAKKWKEDGIEFIKLGPDESPEHEVVGNWIHLIKLLKFCKVSRVNCVYYDDWTFLRERPLERLFFHIGLKTLGIRVVVDQRDPRIDFDIATGNLKEGSIGHRELMLQYRMISKYTDLSIFPSEVYLEEMKSQRLASKNSLGTIRGIDIDRFKDTGAGEEIRRELGIDDKFVVGWFGRMYHFRRIEEVIIPLIKNASTFIPNIYFIIGGQGELKNKFDEILENRPEANFHLAGSIPYGDLPKYIAACNVLLSPLDFNHRLTLYSSPLKILESLAVGRPIIATSIKVQKQDYANLAGVIWTGMEYDDFLKVIIEVFRNYDVYRRQAVYQAGDFVLYSTAFNMDKIANRMEELL